MSFRSRQAYQGTPSGISPSFAFSITSFRALALCGVIDWHPQYYQISVRVAYQLAHLVLHYLLDEINIYLALSFNHAIEFDSITCNLRSSKNPTHHRTRVSGTPESLTNMRRTTSCIPEEWFRG